LAGFGTQIKKRRSENGTNKNRANSLDTKTAEDDIMNRLKNYSPETKEAAVGSIDRTQDAPMVGEAVIAKKEEKRERKVVAAKIDGKAIKPKMKAEMKDRLEEILIERIALNPKDIEAYERLGEYYMEIENFEFAKECFKQVIKLDPTNKNVKYKMRRLEYVLGR
jgi:tetratricopeptide (TPR) repeat protein